MQSADATELKEIHMTFQREQITFRERIITYLPADERMTPQLRNSN